MTEKGEGGGGGKGTRVPIRIIEQTSGDKIDPHEWLPLPKLRVLALPNESSRFRPRCEVVDRSPELDV